MYDPRAQQNERRTTFQGLSAAGVEGLGERRQFGEGGAGPAPCSSCDLRTRVSAEDGFDQRPRSREGQRCHLATGGPLLFPWSAQLQNHYVTAAQRGCSDARVHVQSSGVVAHMLGALWGDLGLVLHRSEPQVPFSWTGEGTRLSLGCAS